jgi:hypothetical protein
VSLALPTLLNKSELAELCLEIVTLGTPLIAQKKYYLNHQMFRFWIKRPNYTKLAFAKKSQLVMGSLAGLVRGLIRHQLGHC